MNGNSLIALSSSVDNESIIDLTMDEPPRTILKPLSKVPKATSSGISFSSVHIFSFRCRDGEDYDMEYKHSSSATMSVDEYERSKQTRVKPSAVIASVLRSKKKREKKHRKRLKRKRHRCPTAKLKHGKKDNDNERLKNGVDLEVKHTDVDSKNYLAGYFNKYIEIINDTGFRLRNETDELIDSSKFPNSYIPTFAAVSVREKSDLKEKLFSHKHKNSAVMIQ